MTASREARIARLEWLCEIRDEAGELVHLVDPTPRVRRDFDVRVRRDAHHDAHDEMSIELAKLREDIGRVMGIPGLGSNP